MILVFPKTVGKIKKKCSIKAFVDVYVRNDLKIEKT
jgi:hypothetical protein